MASIQGCYVVEPTKHHETTIILLHGRGSTGEEFASDFFDCTVSLQGSIEINLKERFPNTRWVFPSAEPRYSTVFQEDMTEWFDIYSLSNPEERQDLQKDGLIKTAHVVQKIVQAELALVSVDKIMIGGISQGFAVISLLVMALNLPLAGVLGLSSWMPFCGDISESISAADATHRAKQLLSMNIPANSDEVTRWVSTPIFIGHEMHDPVVEYSHGKLLFETLKYLNAAIEMFTYNSGEHWIQEPDEITDIVRFISRCLEGDTEDGRNHDEVRLNIKQA